MTTVKWSVICFYTFWFLYMLGMTALNTYCGCAKEYNGWWKQEYWTDDK